jgi:outer membrane protein TolC
MRSLAFLLSFVVIGTATAHAQADLPRLTLRQAIERALRDNPRVLDEVQELERARAQTQQTRSAALPTLTGNATYTRFSYAISFPTGTGGNETVQQANAFGANITAAVPLLAPKAWVKWSQARDAEKLTTLNVGDIKRQVAVTVSSAYLAILSQRLQVDLEVRARDTAKLHADYTHTRLAGGMGSRLDDVRAQQELESDEQLVVSARLALERAQETLGVLVAAETPVDAGEEPELATIDASQAQQDAPKLRLDLLALDARKVLASKIVREDWADYVPALTATFAPIFTYPATAFTAPQWSWQFQLLLTVPFYDGGLRYGLARERKALVREAAIDQEAALRQTRSDLRIGDTAVRKTDEALQRARAAAKLAHEAVTIADLAYHAGATTNIELIDAERRARDADTAANIAADASRQARLDVLFAAGRLP